MIIKALCVIGAKARNGSSPLWPGCRYDVDDDTAQRLIAQEVAEFEEISARPAPADRIPRENPPEKNNAPEGPSQGETDTADLESMSFADLKAMAKGMGIETGKFRSKVALIEAIRAKRQEMPADDELPDLTPQDFVDE